MRGIDGGEFEIENHGTPRHGQNEERAREGNNIIIGLEKGKTMETGKTKEPLSEPGGEKK